LKECGFGKTRRERVSQTRISKNKGSEAGKTKIHGAEVSCGKKWEVWMGRQDGTKTQNTVHTQC
jgi:hypothetical protein